MLGLILSFSVKSQINLDLKFNYEDEKKFGSYVIARHNDIVDFNSWKKENKILYVNELWYYSHSFYIKRNHFISGEILDETIIDISRFESSRHETEEVIIPAVGFRDAIVLLPKNKLKYNPYK